MTPGHWAGRALDLILRDQAPDLVLLFGSAAKGAAAPDDIDLAVIRATPLPRRLRGLDVREQLRCLPVRIDAVFITPEELRAGWARPGSFAHSVLTTGVCLYRRQGLDESPGTGYHFTVRSDLGCSIEETR